MDSIVNSAVYITNAGCSSATCKISGSSLGAFADTSRFGIENISSGTVDGRKNWWGHGSGPTEGSPGCTQPLPRPNPAASGFKVSCRVLFDQFFIGDDDGDGFHSRSEVVIGTDPLDACANTIQPNDEPLPDAWPPDMNDDTYVDIADIVFLTVRFGKSVPPESARFNIAPDPPDGFVDITDIARMTGLFGRQCPSPPP